MHTDLYKYHKNFNDAFLLHPVMLQYKSKLLVVSMGNILVVPTRSAIDLFKFKRLILI